MRLGMRGIYSSSSFSARRAMDARAAASLKGDGEPCLFHGSHSGPRALLSQASGEAAAKLTQAQLAEPACVRKLFIWRIESDHAIHLATITPIAAALDCSNADLFIDQPIERAWQTETMPLSDAPHSATRHPSVAWG
jgi:hypothetical protein